LEQGKSVLLLAPEVALACQLWSRVKSRFPEGQTIFYHGYQSPNMREESFLKVAEDGPFIVVGTRSSLFLPFKHLGLIILDEEHDESFKQDERLVYHAKEIAYSRIQHFKGLLVLGSATPDVKTFYAAKRGALPVHALDQRIGNGTLPDVKVLDVSTLKQSQTFSDETAVLLRETIEAGDQVVVMLNRRGYSPVMYCTTCKETVRCDQCEVGMTWHKGRERLVCHYCGKFHSFPMTCPNCKSAEFVPMGGGTERVEEALSEMLPPDTGVLRLDRDSTRRQERMEEILSDFREGKAQVLVGTQMLSKGHHFPNVTLVVVVDGDLGLGLPDYRASERIFQLLVQVSGRAGRGEKSGRVVIQTRNPEHEIWQQVIHADYAGFYEREIERRERLNYPPFTKLALIRVSFPVTMKTGEKSLNELTDIFQSKCMEAGVIPWGPIPAPLSLVKGRKRFVCMLKVEDWTVARTIYAEMARANRSKQVRVVLDLDPLSML